MLVSASFGVANTVFVYGATSAAFCVVMCFVIPEIKNRSYVELNELFELRVSTRQFAAFIFPNHNPDTSHAYYGSIARFLQNSASSAPALDNFGLDSTVSTIAPSRQSSPPLLFGPLCYKRKIGSDSFSNVELVVDPTSGDVAARKRFRKLKTLP
ncbi:hypothetical protein SPI_03732 [Niveomyces insectorum RCEF 264]|uniref:General substrate transporter n=1 Tax=Niveomyces insectorum RCEF 264 TaxID=1081102 RepID=A0A167WB97_9HYPO|nr:hypothetical protein SPI_03732 [Niveomyces insectorum RCEF 264]